MTTYKIVRFFQDDRPPMTIETCLTLEEAQAHCNDPATSSVSGTAEPTSDGVDWFDGYTEE